MDVRGTSGSPWPVFRTSGTHPNNSPARVVSVPGGRRPDLQVIRHLQGPPYRPASSQLVSGWSGTKYVHGALGRPSLKGHLFLTGFGVPKMVPKILQADRMFYVVFATLASQTVLAEKLKVFKKARRDASSPVFQKPPGEWEECYF